MDNTDTGLSTVVLTNEYSVEVVEIHSSIRDTRARIEANLRELEEEVAHRFNPRAWVRKNPRRAVGFAFALGLYVGLK